MDERGTLNIGEFHPAATSAYHWLKGHSFADLATWLEAFASNAIEGNRLAEICAETLNRYMRGEPISDRYLLGLVWVMRFAENAALRQAEEEEKELDFEV